MPNGWDWLNYINYVGALDAEQQKPVHTIIPGTLSSLARARLKIIYENTDGFEIAQQDFNLRGPGELLGARQSGTPILRFANLNEDVDLLDRAHAIADEMLSNFQQEAHAHLERWIAQKQDYLHA